MWELPLPDTSCSQTVGGVHPVLSLRKFQMMTVSMPFKEGSTEEEAWLILQPAALDSQLYFILRNRRNPNIALVKKKGTAVEELLSALTARPPILES